MKQEAFEFLKPQTLTMGCNPETWDENSLDLAGWDGTAGTQVGSPCSTARLGQIRSPSAWLASGQTRSLWLEHMLILSGCR